MEIDYRSEVYSIPKWAGVKTKEVRARLGDEAEQAVKRDQAEKDKLVFQQMDSL